MEAIFRERHLINKLAPLEELDKFVQFCRKYRKIYIISDGMEEYIIKYLYLCEIKNFYGVIKVESKFDAIMSNAIRFLKKIKSFNYRNLSCQHSVKMQYTDDVGVVIAGMGNINRLERFLNKKGFMNKFILSEFSTRAIAEAVAPRTKEEMAFEINLVDHCNLSCQMCDHFSQLSEEKYLDIESFKRDMTRMGEIFQHDIGGVYLLGGEPTLHPQLIEIIEYTRTQFPKTELILLTNGMLLTHLENGERGNLWRTLKECNVHVTVTVYPLKINYLAIEEMARKYNVVLMMSSDIHAPAPTRQIKISDKHTLDLYGSQPKHHCVHCLYFNKFNVLKDGKYYMCPIQAHIDIFNRRFDKNLEHIDGDFLDIYKIDDWREFAEYSSNWVPFCRFCDQKKWGHASEWKSSTKCIEEYI